MIRSLFSRLFKLNYKYGTLIEQQRAQRLLSIMSITIFGALIWVVFITLPVVMSNQAQLVDLIALTVLIACVGLNILIQRGQLLWSSRFYTLFIFLATVIPQINNVNSASLVAVILPIVVAGVLLDRAWLLFITGVIVAVIMRGAIVVDESSTFLLATAIGLSLTVSLSGIFLALFNANVEDITQSASEVITQIRKLRAHKIDETPESNQEIIRNAINILRSQLGYSYVRVIMLDDNHQPQQTYYSSIGVEQVAETTAFSFSSNSAFQQAIDRQSAVTVRNTDSDAVTSHLLPSSYSGVIIPAISFNEMVALFDIQTEAQTVISTETVAVLTLFISQLAGNLVYQSTVSALRNDISEQQTLITQQRQQLQNIQLQQTEGIVTDWEYYLQQRGFDSIGYDIDDRRQVSNLNIGGFPEELRPAFERGEIVVQAQEDKQLVTIPISFRDTILGAMSFAIPPEIPISDRKLDFIRSVTERLALALDNKRLLEQTQTQALRESTANEIGSLLLSSTDVQSVLQTAANHFNEALGAITTQIYLQPTTLQSTDNQQVEDTV